MASAENEAELDIIIIGGSIAGCVLASRLHEKLPSLSILLEADPTVSQHPLAKNASAYLQHSELDWDYKTVPQKHLNGRVLDVAAGKGVGVLLMHAVGSVAIGAIMMRGVVCLGMSDGRIRVCYLIFGK